VTHRRIWRDLDADLFRFTTTDLRDLHIALMSAFEAAAVMSPALDLDHVRQALTVIGWDEPTDDEALQRALTSLTGWGLLEATQNHAARYATPHDFERKNLQWSLSRRGEAATAGVLHAFDQLRSAVGLQPAVLDAIDGATTPESDARIHIHLAEVENHLASLVASVRQFNGYLQALLRDDGTDDVVFADVKRRTVAYLEEYADGVERRHRRLRAAIAGLHEIGPALLFDRALAGANLAPLASGDPGPAWIAERRRRWSGIEAWFAPPPGEQAQILGLLAIARTAIVELLRALERRWDQRRRSASIAHDLRRLAGWFAACASDDDAHRLFGAAFGMWSSRHAHLSPVDGEARDPRRSWGDATPVDVAPALRTSGSLANRGPVRPVRDVAALRARRQREQAEVLRTHHLVQTALATEGVVRLSHFAQLPAHEFRELLALLSLGLEAALASDGARRATSLDGQVEIVLRHPHDRRVAHLRTDSGVLSGPDLLVSIDTARPRTAPPGPNADRGVSTGELREAAHG
jgi:uncharacterized protein (TIGR02677 family)